jgi:hypothetical protein
MSSEIFRSWAQDERFDPPMDDFPAADLKSALDMQAIA